MKLMQDCIAKGALTKMTPFVSKLNLKTKLENCYICSIALHGAETRARPNIDQTAMK